MLKFNDFDKAIDNGELIDEINAMIYALNSMEVSFIWKTSLIASEVHSTIECLRQADTSTSEPKQKWVLNVILEKSQLSLAGLQLS